LYSRCLIHLEYLAIKSPSGEGKSYVLHKVGENFPPEDVMFVAGMTDRALVLKNEIGEYESIDEKILKMDSDIDDKQNEIRTTKDANLQQARQNQTKELQTVIHTRVSLVVSEG